MKRRWTISLALTLLLGMAAPMMAQTEPNVPMEGRRKREIPSPESNARRIMGEFKKTFQLTDKEYDKVYDLYLKQEKSLMPEMGAGFRGGMPSRGGFGGPGGGFGGPGGGFGGPGGGFGGGFGGPGEGMGMPPQGDFQPRGDRQMPEEMKAMMEERRKEQAKKQEKAFNALRKKMTKILKGEEYARWEQWETDRKSKPRKP